MPADAREIIRPAIPQDAPALSGLFREVFGIERPERVWHWKYFSNPRGSASFVCEADGRLVAHCGGIPVRFRDFEREYSALQSVDFMSSPSYPGGIGSGGVFVRTANRFFDAYCGPSTVPLVYGFPGERHRVLGEKLLGYHPIEAVGELTLRPEGDSVRPQPLRLPDLALFERLPIEFGTIRDRTYLRWRYLQNPLFDYSIVQLKRALHLHPRIGAIVRMTDEAVYLMEIGGRFSRSSLTALTQALRNMGRPVIFWCSPTHPIARLMKESGFEGATRDHHLECRFFIQREVPRGGEMYYTLGDYDVH